jgi:hypothetical protein
MKINKEYMQESKLSIRIIPTIILKNTIGFYKLLQGEKTFIASNKV